MFVEYRTRQVLNLARFVAPFCIYVSLYMLSPCKCNILRHKGTLFCPEHCFASELEQFLSAEFGIRMEILSHYRIVLSIPILFLYYPFFTKFLSQLLSPSRIYRP